MENPFSELVYRLAKIETQSAETSKAIKDLAETMSREMAPQPDYSRDFQTIFERLEQPKGIEMERNRHELLKNILTKLSHLESSITGHGTVSSTSSTLPPLDGQNVDTNFAPKTISEIVVEKAEVNQQVREREEQNNVAPNAREKPPFWLMLNLRQQEQYHLLPAKINSQSLAEYLGSHRSAITSYGSRHPELIYQIGKPNVYHTAAFISLYLQGKRQPHRIKDAPIATLEDPYFSTEELCWILNYSRTNLHNNFQRMHIPSVKIAGRKKVSKAVLVDCIRFNKDELNKTCKQSIIYYDRLRNYVPKELQDILNSYHETKTVEPEVEQMKNVETQEPAAIEQPEPVIKEVIKADFVPPIPLAKISTIDKFQAMPQKQRKSLTPADMCAVLKADKVEMEEFLSQKLITATKNNNMWYINKKTLIKAFRAPASKMIEKHRRTIASSELFQSFLTDSEKALFKTGRDFEKMSRSQRVEYLKKNSQELTASVTV